MGVLVAVVELSEFISSANEAGITALRQMLKDMGIKTQILTGK